MLTKVASLAKFKKCLDLARIPNFLFAWGGEKVSAGCLIQGGELLVLGESKYFTSKLKQ